MITLTPLFCAFDLVKGKRRVLSLQRYNIEYCFNNCKIASLLLDHINGRWWEN
jgi:hypothetical protein